MDIENRRGALASLAALVGCITLCSCGGSDSGLPDVGQRTATQACTAFAGQVVAGATVASAAMVPAAGSAKEYCQVKGALHQTLQFEIRLPTVWNKKLVFIGGGGWDTVPFAFLGFHPEAAAGDYALVASNGGNPTNATFDASGFLNNPTAQQDFAYASTHSVLEVAKRLVATRYPDALQRSYFSGCSNGGREGLIAASRYPDDFDGVVAKAPAYTFTQLMAGAFYTNSKAVVASGGWISPAKSALVAQAVVNQCDALDGATDGIVSNAAACTFNPEVLRCTGAPGDTCLTQAELTTVKTAYAELRDPDGTLVYPGWGPGGEDLGWPSWLSGAAPGQGAQYSFADNLIKYWLTSNPTYAFADFNRQAFKSQLSLLSSTLDASPDLRDFFAKGKKLILVHGTHDWAISYKGTVKYFNDVAASTGASQRDANTRFYLLPGVQHCSGGVGPDTADYLTPLDAWVERGTAPSGIVASKLGANGQAQLTRPVCQYPAFPKYKGSGDINQASSYSCATS